jgi:hypothetical protein
MLARTLRLLAVADYAVRRDVPGFRNQLSETVRLRSRLFDRLDAGEPISPSFVSMSAYSVLLSALAAGNEALSEAFARQLGGRDSIERKYDRPFDIAFGYSLKSLLTSDDDAAKRWIESLDLSCQEASNADFGGYAKVLAAVVRHDGASAQAAFAELLEGHRNQCRDDGIFTDTEDEVLCMWGLGVANLARFRGVAVQPNDSLIPVELLVTEL